ncbi:MAG TPA: electron transfer flavoprotein subunit alpha/FixB family protein [Gaiellaceae bacterium]
MILCLVEHAGGAPSDLSLQALTLARRLGEPLEAVLIGEEGRDAAAALGAFGASRVHLVVDDRLAAYAPAAWGECLVGLIGEHAPQAVVAAATDRGHEALAYAGARLDLPLAANCVDVRPGPDYELIRQRWGGSLLEEARLSGSTRLLTLAPHVVAAEQAPSPATAAVEEVRPALGDEAFRARVVRREEPEAGVIQLTDARVVVGGGRGVGSAEGFAVLEELAGLLGGAVGGSRVVTNLGWRAHADQIGQTGARIAPELYIACGVSGAIQHMVGAKGAKRILAINKDRDAPLVARATYAVIGDLHEVVPAIVAELRKE